MKQILLIILMLSAFAKQSFSQDQHLIDSLQRSLTKHNSAIQELRIKSPSSYDTTAADILSALSRAYWGSNPDKAVDFANQCLAISEQIAYKKGIGNAFNSLGVIKDDKGDFLPALDFHKKALQVREEIADKKGIAGSYTNIGYVYGRQGNYTEALKNYFVALRKYEAIADNPGIAKVYNNMGMVNYIQGDYTTAMRNYEAALKIKAEIGDKQGMAPVFNNIGSVYTAQKNYPEALKNYSASLKIYEGAGNKMGIANSYNNIGTIYTDEGNFSEALKNHLASLKIKEEIGHKEGIASSYYNIGLIYFKQKKYVQADKFVNMALQQLKAIGSLEYIKLCYQSLAMLDSARGNYSKALKQYKLFVIYRDSIVNEENTKKTVTLQMNYDFEKKQDSISAVQSRKDAVAVMEINKQKQQKYGLSAGFAVMLLFAVVFFRQRNKIKQGKKKSDELLLNILPAEVADELKQFGHAEAKQFNNVTVLFTDFVGFTLVCGQLTAKELVAEINTCFTAFDRIIEKYGLEKIKTIGDAYLAVCGLPVADKDSANKTVEAAMEIIDYLSKRKVEGGHFQTRIGINSGSVVAGIVGVKKFAYDIWGDTVNIAARMESSGEAGKINISSSTYQLVKERFLCSYRGKIEAKNIGDIDMYFVEGRK